MTSVTSGIRDALDSALTGGTVRWRPDVSRALVEASAAYLAADQPNVGVLIRDARGAIVGVDNAAQFLLGLTWDELVTPPPELRPRSLVGETGDPLARDRTPDMSALARGEVVVAACVGVLGDPDAPTQWFEVSAFPLFAPRCPAARRPRAVWSA